MKLQSSHVDTPSKCVTLSGGTTVICEPVNHAEAAAIGFWFLHGSRDEITKENGFSHFLEHMIFKGTGRRTPRDIACEIDRVGGSINAGTEKEVTSVFTSVPGEYLPVVLDVMCDIAFGSTLPDEEITKEKLVVQNEISSIEDSPEEMGFELFVETIWQGHPLAEKITGSLESITTVTRAKLEKFYRKHFRPSRLLVSAAGAIDPVSLCDMLEKKIAEYGMTKENASGLPTRTPPPFCRGAHIVEDTFTQAQIFYARLLPTPAKIRDYYEQLLVSTAFGESMSSRLFQTIREEEGLCYTVYSSRAYYSDTALWMIYASTMPELLGQLLQSLARELNTLRRHPCSQKEIDEARLQIKGSLILARQDVEVRMKRLARQYIAMGSILSYEECFGIIDSITKADLDQQINQLFADDGGAALLVYGAPGIKNSVVDSSTSDFRL